MRDPFSESEASYIAPNLVVGLGNAFRADDQTGLLVARQVKQKYSGSAAVEIIEGVTDSLNMVNICLNRSKIFIIDAVVDDSRPPGSIIRWVLTDDMPPITKQRSYSTHAIDLKQVMAMTACLSSKNSRFIVYGIVGRCFDVGKSCSRVLIHSISDTAGRIITELS